MLLLVQVDASGNSLVSVSGGVSTSPSSTNRNLEENQLLETSSSSSSAAPEREVKSTEPEAEAGRVSASGPPASPHKDFHCAVLKALSVTTDLSGHGQTEQDSQAEGSLVCHLPALAWNPFCPL